MKIKHPVLLLLISIPFWMSCREVYYPEDLNSGKSIPVIHGQIQEGNPPVAEISYAMNYDDFEPRYISGATVIITDNAGNSAQLVENDPGHYEAIPGEMTGVAGRIYKMRILLDNGQEFESQPEKLPVKPIIDSLYAVPATKTAVKFDQYYNPVTYLQEGLKIYSSLSAPGDSTQYYRFDTKFLKESTFIRDPGTVVATPVFVWKTDRLDNTYSVDYTMTRDNMQFRPAHEIGFLEYVYDPTLATNRASAPITIGWVLTFKVNSVSRDVYDYYKSIADQLNSSDQIFAPTPSQVKSNIRCTSDPNAPLVGLFEANATTVVYKAFRYVDQDKYQFKELEAFPEGIKDGQKLYLPPQFWITFN
jgi:hypothetical protein